MRRQAPGRAADRGGYPLPIRLLMAAVGVTLLVFYSVLAYGSYLVLRWLLSGLSGTDLLGTAVLVVGLTLVLGYLTHQYGTAQLLYGLDASEIPRGRAPELYRMVDDLADRMDVPAPTVAVARMEMPNALAIGRGGGGTVVLDGRLFRLLDAAELETIVAHELAHLESRDSLVQTLAYSLVRTVVGVLSMLLFPVTVALHGVSRATAWLRGRPTARTPPVDRVRAVVARVVLGLLVVLTLAVRAHSRGREYAADERAAAVTGRPIALARALRKIERATRPASGLLSTLYVHAEDEEDPLTRLLSTHPPMDERVERLVEMAEQRGRTTGDAGGIRIPVR